MCKCFVKIIEQTTRNDDSNPNGPHPNHDQGNAKYHNMLLKQMYF